MYQNIPNGLRMLANVLKKKKRVRSQEREMESASKSEVRVPNESQGEHDL